LIKVVVEHLEPCINEWIMAEYEFVSELFRGRVIFSNVSRETDRSKLARLGEVWSSSVTEVLRDSTRVLILDPQAEKSLEPEDLSNVDYVVIGGIMGSHPPEGRTKKLISNRMPKAMTRNIGRQQFTIAGAAYVLHLVERGVPLSSVRVVFGYEFKIDVGRGVKVSVYLPYAFPVDEAGNVVLPRSYIEKIIKMGLYEHRVLRGEDNPC